ncbi:PREDICTED: macrophage erythroblast attacher-like [Camelina sativa]|uniref:Macrophage erythroblast attacher-like n=1 Tax=Camelina sativa TaxID=90675 RepID=A0ABM0TJC7_CAMSA|nr:PREDICTED: macrophage erythroblast attacher-like [Camelina sativa]
MEIDTVTNGNSDTVMTETTPTITPSPVVPSSRLSQLTESLKLEHQLLRVPFEHYKKTIRTNHRSFEKEVSTVVSGVGDLADSDWSKDVTVSRLSSLVSRLQGLKRKLEEGSNVENLQAQRCRARIDHLDSVDVENITEWNNTKLKRILVDYMLRMSYFETATKLSESSNILDLVDIDIFREAKKVIDALKNREVASALSWCADNKTRLKKSKSKFEFQLRLQEFIELVRVDRADSYKQAIHYARKHLAPWGATHMKELQHVLATLAFKSTTECSKYKVLFELRQWDVLVNQFKQEFCKLYGMTMEPLLNIYLQAGLSALKTPYGFEEGCTKEDPLSQENFRKLALPLPFSKQHHSKLVCYISKELMDTENPPQVLPNGYVYSTKALKEMAEKNGGKITCPRTGFACDYTELVKAYIS